MTINKRRISVLLSRAFLLFFLVLTVGLPGRQTVQAAYDNTSGNYTWFSHSGTIYRMHIKSGKLKKIRTLISTRLNPVQDIRCWGNYLYFCLDSRKIEAEPGLEGRWICRMKKDGSEFTPLQNGFDPQIYKGHLYYVSTSYDAEEGTESVLGIARINLAGKKHSLLLRSSAVKGIALLRGVIYYLSDSGSYYEYVRSYHIKSQKRYIIYKDIDGFMDLTAPDGDSLCITTARRGVLRYYPKKQMTRKYIPSVDGYAIHGIQGGWIYYSEGRTLLRIHLSTGRKQTIKKLKTGEPTGLLYGGAHWVIITQDIVSGKYSRGVVRMRVNGKNAKVLTRWYEK